MKYTLYYFLLLFCSLSYAQLYIDNAPQGAKVEYTPEQLVKTVLVIPNPLYSSAPQTVFPTNVIYNGTAAKATIYNDQIGKWETNLNAGNLGLGKNEYGVLLTTGKTEIVFGPNNEAGATGLSDTPIPVQGDPDLLMLSGGKVVRNVSILEFDFIATGPTVSFEYVFGSEEYPEFAPPIREDFNDAFGFFISGQGINGPFTDDAENIALLPTTGTASSVVSINNVNAVRNKNYFVTNGNGTTPALNLYTQYDGFTTLLKATANLVCGQTYHIKLAIGNVNDNGWDSGVFLKNFVIPPFELKENFGLTDNPEVCFGEKVVITTGDQFPADAIYTWKKDGFPYGGNTKDIIVTDGGTYSVEINQPSTPSCLPIKDDIIIAYLPEVPFNNPSVIPQCNAPFIFNIDKTTEILGPLSPIDYWVTYYDSATDVPAYEGGLDFKCTVANGKFPNYTMATTGTKKIFARIESQIDGCVVVKSFELNAGLPTTPNATATFQPTCTSPSGTIVVSSPLGVEYEYSINGGAFQSSPTFSGLGINTYTIIAKNIIAGCESVPSQAIKIENASAPQNILYNVTQPSCPTPVGEIVFTSPVGSNYEYSIDGGTNFQSSPTFDNLASNTYSIVVKDVGTGCPSSPEPVIIDPLPVKPAAPTTTVVQPDCATASGSVAITAPLGTDYEYSNGGAYQASPDFTGLLPNTSYDFTVRNKVTACVSNSATTVLIDPALNVPNAPTATVTVLPTCALPTGTITVTAPIGVNLEYSKDGITYQTGTIFNNLTPDTDYSITVRDNGSGCVSPITVVYVNATPGSPNAPNATLTQPNCYVNTGSISITSPIGANLEYSKDGINYQSSPDFSGLLPNTDGFITVKNTITSCISAGTKFTVDAIPANPIVPTGNVTQPTCTVQTGTIIVTSPLGADFEYSINGGGVYQKSTTFADLLPNKTYNIIVLNRVTGCVSSQALFTVDPLPSIPATPIATVDNNSPCETTSFTLNTPTVIGATYSWTGPNGFTSSEQNPTITNATTNMSGVYNVVIALVSDCPSLPGSVTVTVAPTPTPILEDGFVCVDGVSQVVTSDYTLNSGLSTLTYNFEWFEIVAGVPNVIPNQTSNAYVVNAPGTYGVRAENKTTKCISAIVTANVVASSPPTSIEITTSDYFAQFQTITVSATPTGNYVYQIDNGSFQTSNVFNNVSSGEHKIVVKDSEGCGEIIEFVNTIDYPKYFTPNGDGYNDTWNISTLSNQPNAKISIFDKFGKLIQQIRPSGPGWDGSYNGKNLPSTDYWFHVNYSESGVEKIFRAHFTLKR